MVDHYFGGYREQHLSADQRAALEHAWGGLEGRVALTPAQLEQLCAEHDAPEELCSALEVLGGQLAQQAT
jgi:hypothetical protein